MLYSSFLWSRKVIGES